MHFASRAFRDARREAASRRARTRASGPAAADQSGFLRRELRDRCRSVHRRDLPVDAKVVGDRGEPPGLERRLERATYSRRRSATVFDDAALRPRDAVRTSRRAGRWKSATCSGIDTAVAPARTPSEGRYGAEASPPFTGWRIVTAIAHELEGVAVGRRNLDRARPGQRRPRRGSRPPRSPPACAFAKPNEATRPGSRSSCSSKRVVEYRARPGSPAGSLGPEVRHRQRDPRRRAPRPAARRRTAAAGCSQTRRSSPRADRLREGSISAARGRPCRASESPSIPSRTPVWEGLGHSGRASRTPTPRLSWRAPGNGSETKEKGWTLVIVESPAKAKTIAGYLGKRTTWSSPRSATSATPSALGGRGSRGAEAGAVGAPRGGRRPRLRAALRRRPEEESRRQRPPHQAEVRRRAPARGDGRRPRRRGDRLASGRGAEAEGAGPPHGLP